MEPEQILILLEKAADSIKYANADDETQFAYNEGIADLIIEFENLIQSNLKN